MPALRDRETAGTKMRLLEEKLKSTENRIVSGRRPASLTKCDVLAVDGPSKVSGVRARVSSGEGVGGFAPTNQN